MTGTLRAPPAGRALVGPGDVGATATTTGGNGKIRREPTGNAARLFGMIFDGHVHQLPDIDASETKEWLDSLDAVVDQHGKARARTRPPR